MRCRAEHLSPLGLSLRCLTRPPYTSFVVLQQQARHAWYADGELWFVRSAADGKSARFRTVAGFELVSKLLESAGQEQPVLVLLGAQEQNRSIDTADRQTLLDFRRRLADIDNDIDEAARYNDPHRADKLSDEREALLAALRSMLDRHGRQRGVGGDSERARVRATRAIRACIGRIAPELPLLAEHLTIHVRTGGYCSYTGERSSWELSQSESVALGVAQEQIEPLSAATPADTTVVPARLSPVEPASVPFTRLAPRQLDEHETVAWFGADRCLAALGDLSQSVRPILLVSGGPGSGKSRFLRELQRRQADSGVLIMYGSNDDRFSVPFQPFERAFSELVERHGNPAVLGPQGRQLASLLPHLFHEGSTADIGSVRPDHLRTIDAVVGWFATTPTSQPVALVIEDLHHATEDTVNLLMAIIQRTRVGLFLSYDPHSVPLSHPSHRLMAELVTGHAHVQAIEMSPLTAADLAEAIEALLPPSVGPRSAIAGWVMARAEGNALLSLELIRSLRSVPAMDISRLIRQRDPRLDVIQSVAGAERTRLKQIVRGRLTSDLGAETIRVLQRAAVLGQEFDPETLAALTQREFTDLYADLTAASDRGIVAVSRRVPLRFRFTNGIVRDVLYEDLSELDRIVLHTRAGEHLSNSLAQTEPDRSAHLAYHFSHAAGSGRAADAVRYAERAGDDAYSRRGFGDAAGWYANVESLLNQHGLTSTSEVDPVHLAIRRGCAETRAGLAEGRATLLRAAQMALTAGRMQDLRQAALEANRGLFSQALKADDQWISIISQALESTEDPDTTAELQAILASEMLWSEHADNRFALSDAALATAREHGSAQTLARVLFRRGHTVASAANWTHRLEEADEQLEAATETEDELLILQAMQSCASALLAAGDAPASLAFGEEMLRRADRLGLPVWKFMAFIGKAGLLVHEGLLDEASRAVGSMFSLGVQAGYQEDAMSFAADLSVTIARWRDDLSAMVQPMLAIAADPVQCAQVGFLVGPRLFDAGETAAAQQVLDAVVERGVHTLAPNFLEFSALTNLAYLSARLHDPRIASDLMTRLAGLEVSFPCTTTTGPCGLHSTAMLHSLLGNTATAAEMFRRAIDLHHQQGAPLLALESTFELGLILHGNGAYDEAKTHFSAVALQAERLGARFLSRRAHETASQ